MDSNLLISVRRWNQNDINRLLKIEEEVHVSPWNKDAFLMCLQQSYIGYVATILDREKKQTSIIGSIICSIQVEECHILNIGVSMPYQRQGVGKMLLTHALEVARKDYHARVAFLEVRRSNTRAITLYKRFNFEQVAERKHYYQGPHEPEDALIFIKLLTLPAAS